ncbi:transposase [Natronococcus sp. A-GB7]|uniref:transposase n=1 Tax=Natronococcus sp. A-GB7 TaxID=3037649 RepID=UPI0024200999|nr:transposase [Natronococcus sp. A-GB7]MDG5820192.1 transposase [Natronococcus sp. A-GB7]
MKTVELKLVDPNAHKERKLWETKQAYQCALEAAFEANCTSKSATNDIVVEYDLSGYAKNALKKYVPQLCGGSYNAKALSDDHPVRFTNEGICLDRKPENRIEWYVKIPHHEDYNLWLPAAINPEQRSWIEAVYSGETEMGESRLIHSDGEWYLHITVRTDTTDYLLADSEDQTPIGVDVGDAALATVCHRDECGAPTSPLIFSDEASWVRDLRKTYFTAVRRLQRRGSERLSKEYGEDTWNQIGHIISCVSREIVDHARAVDNPILVLEDLTGIQDSIDADAFMNRRLHKWSFAKLHEQIRYKAHEVGIPVATVDPQDTSKRCHACGEEGTRPQQATFRCSNDDCWVSEYQADLNAALNIADRYLAGESQSRTDQKATGDDSSEDGASLAGPQDSRSEDETRPSTSRPNAS